MKFDTYEYSVHVRLTLSRAELTHLIDLAQHHYDGRCKAAAAVGGFLYGLTNMIMDADTVTNTFDGDELQTLAKICESELYLGDRRPIDGPCPMLYFPLRRILAEADEEWKRISKRNNPCRDKTTEDICIFASKDAAEARERYDLLLHQFERLSDKALGSILLLAGVVPAATRANRILQIVAELGVPLIHGEPDGSTLHGSPTNLNRPGALEPAT